MDSWLERYSRPHCFSCDNPGEGDYRCSTQSPGNSDSEMVELIKRRGHSTTDNYHATYTDVVDVTNCDGVQYTGTIHHNKCEILCQ